MTRAHHATFGFSSGPKPTNHASSNVPRLRVLICAVPDFPARLMPAILARLPVPAAPGRPACRDYEYARRGTANLFLAVEPLAGVRHLTVTEHRGTVDFAEQMRPLCDEWYSEAAVIRAVLDNLNTHGPQPLEFPTDGGRADKSVRSS